MSRSLSLLPSLPPSLSPSPIPLPFSLTTQHHIALPLVSSFKTLVAHALPLRKSHCSYMWPSLPAMSSGIIPWSTAPSSLSSGISSPEFWWIKFLILIIYLSLNFFPFFSNSQTIDFKGKVHPSWGQVHDSQWFSFQKWFFDSWP